MPKPKQKSVPQTRERAQTAEEESDVDDTPGLPDMAEQRVDADTSSLQTILQELREFRRENVDTLREIREDIKATNNRVEEAEMRISETEERVQGLEEATTELLKLQAKLEDRLTDQEGRARRENIRIHGIEEGSESNSSSMITFVENLLREKLPPTHDLKIERAHRRPKPPAESPPRSIVAKFSSSKTKEEILKLVWQKRGFLYKERRVFVDHDYAPETLKKRREYAEAKKVLRENNTRFQTPFPARLRVFYEGETCLYNSAEEAMTDMVKRGLPVTIFKPPVSWADRVKNLMWRKVRSPGRAEQQPETPRDGFKKRLDVFRRSDR